MLFFTITGKRLPVSIPQKRQLLRAMKLTTFLLVAVYLHVSAVGLGQKVTISGKDLPLEKVFSMIKKQTGYTCFYDYSLLQGKAVSLDLKDVNIEEAMNACLRNQGLNFSITGKQITIQQRIEKTMPVAAPAYEKTIKAYGIVYNESGQPLSGANVTIKATSKGTITNAKGEFELPAIPENSTLVISFIGYAPQNVNVIEGRTVQVYLNVATNDLDKVVIQAYGKTTQRLATGNIATVTAAEIERQPVMNPLLALQGKVAGLEVNQTSGYASAPIKVELRGRNTINDKFTSDPLYIIDGVPLTVLDVNGGSNYTQGSSGFIQSGISGPANGQSPLFSVNPADIESIEVLKDADATAIYGSRGSNGVILISTKKGKPGKAKVDLHLQEGITRVTKFWKMMDTRQYLQMRREAYRNDGRVPTIANGAYDLLQWDTTRNTDWQKMLYGNTGKNVDVQAGLSGGDVYNNFRLGAGYNRMTNILSISGADQRASLSLNLGHHSRDQRFGLSLSTLYSFAKTDMVSINSNILTLPPNAPAVYDSLGNFNFNGWGAQNARARRIFPFGNLKNPYSATTNFLNSSLGLSYQLARGLKLTTSIGYGSAQAKQKTFSTIASQDPAYDPTGGSQFGISTNANWSIEPNMTYDVFLGKGKINLLLGGSIQQTTTEGYYLSGSGYTSDDLLKTLSAAPEQGEANYGGEYKYAAFFGRINYNWENKYLLNINARRDGSSRFGSGKQYGNFGSLGAAWIFTEESWFKNHFPILSFGKARASYGITGSDAIGDYGYLTRWQYPTGYVAIPYNGSSPLQPIQHANPEYHWQVNKKLELAMDLGLFKDRIALSIVYYRDRVGNQLINFPTPALSGFSSVVANSPALVQNAGWEFNFSVKIVDTRRFKWSVNANAAFNKNILLAYPNISQSPYAYTLMVGQPLNISQKFHNTGVDPLTGLYTFQDKNKDGVLSYSSAVGGGDYYPINLTPKFFGGMGMNFSYMNFQLNLQLNIKDQIGTNAYILAGSNAGNAKNQPVQIIGKEWQKPGDQTSISRFGTNTSGNLASNSDLGYTDASFIRLSSISLAYTLPSTYSKKIGMESCNVFVHTNNLFVITKYKGLDPEIQNFGGMPPSKTIVGGLSFNF